MTKHSDVKYMKDFNWNGFLNGEFAVNLRTQDNYDKFMHECEKRNYLEWCTKIELLKQNIWKTYKENTCVDIDCGVMFYGNIKCYHDNNMPIFVYSNSKITENHFDVQEVKHGKWLKPSNSPIDNRQWICSECKGLIETAYHCEHCYYNYCPNCGARMDGDSSDG